MNDDKQSTAKSDNGTTIVSDIDIPFGRMVIVILKAMLAGIPAFILFYVVLILVVAFIGALFGSGLAIFGQ